MPVSDAVLEVRKLLRHHDGVDPLLVGVDGCSGAGKSTLAAALVGELGGAVVKLEDFYRPMDPERRRGLDAQTGYELYFDWQRLIAEVLDPLVLGEPAQYRPYDWSMEALADEPATIRPEGVIVFEGVYSHRPQLRGYWDIAIFVDTPTDVRAKRTEGRADDADWAKRWSAAEDWYLTNVDPRNGADVVVAGF